MTLCMSEEQIRKACMFAMCELDMCNVFFEDFVKNGQVYVFNNWYGRKIEAGTELHKKIEQLELHSHVKVYAVTQDDLFIGKTYSFLCVSPYDDDRLYMVRHITGNQYAAYAYVQNVFDDKYSEFGSVVLLAHRGGLKRMG